MLVHYIGKGVYSKKLFIEEAKRYGVSRAMPWNIAKNLEPGTVILLAIHSGRKAEQGKAEVFGYMVVDGYNLPPNIIDLAGINVECEDRDESVTRGCGSYTVTKECKVREDWGEAVKKLDKIYKQTPFKVFVTGAFKELYPPIIIENAKFSRSVVNIELPDKAKARLKSLGVESVMREITGYHRIRYRSKKEKQALLEQYKTKPLTLYMGGSDEPV